MAGIELRQASVCETWWRLGEDSVEPQHGSFRGLSLCGRMVILAISMVAL